jgi:uncharacterized protein
MTGRSRMTIAGGWPWWRAEARLRQALAGRVHVVADGERAGVFVRETVAVLTCDRRAAAGLRDFLDGASVRAACRQHGLPLQAFELLIGQACQASGEGKGRGDAGLAAVDPGPDDRGPAPGAAPARALDRLVLNVSNDCNLRCAYCYAGGGAYGGPRRLMTPKTARSALDLFLRAFRRIHRIQFFGGEPLLNVEVVEYVARLLEERRDAGTLADPPRLGLVTNGTLDPDAFVRLSRRFGVGVTVSVDGPCEVHDRLRGEGTFDKVRAFTSRLSEAGVEFGIEGTYTALHAQMGIRLVDLLPFYRREFGVTEVHVPWCSRPAGDVLAPAREDVEREYREAVKRSLDPTTRSELAALAFAMRLLEMVSKREPAESYCPAGLDTLAVDADGDIYPCFMFVGQPALRLGNVEAGLLGETAAGERTSKMLAGKTDPECASCWARPLCFGCVGADYVIGGSEFRKSACGAMRAMADEALRRVLILASTQADTAS